MLTEAGFTDEQRELRRAVRTLFVNSWSTELAREYSAGGADKEAEALRLEMAAMGLLGLALPPEYGGAGTLADLGVVYEEAGRALVPTTFAAAGTVARLIADGGSEAQRAALLPGMVEGLGYGVLAVSEEKIHESWITPSTVLNEKAGSLVLEGEKQFVPDAAAADLLLVVARAVSDPSAVEVAIVESNRGGITIAPRRTFGGDRQYLVTYRTVRVGEDDLLGTGPERRARSSAALERALFQSTALQALEMVAGAREAVRIAAEHVRSRMQFGKPLGANQAVQHQLADLAMQIDAAWLAGWRAVWLLEDRHVRTAVSIAKVAAGEAYRAATLTAFQLCGGTGYVTEHPLHLYANRAKSSDLTLGSSSRHLAALGQRLSKDGDVAIAARL